MIGSVLSDLSGLAVGGRPGGQPVPRKSYYLKCNCPGRSSFSIYIAFIRKAR